ncbi:class I SAM-dependent methyltransferase [Streptodolium elevatio]|uniref:Class I SAM-dependent methyltransferase n=1 Tax=Streptodolium elevatio TaxID=3157996 RepID=A0ABV3DE33_9ACTN
MNGDGTRPGAWLTPEAATTFGAAASAYAAHRPGYPRDAVRWALGDAYRPGMRVLDLAAGTGKVSEALAGLPVEVVAVDPDPAMLAELRRSLPGRPALRGSAERIPLADAGFDAVLVGQAFHWFDQVAAMAEIRRVLRPGGLLAAMWNVWDDGGDWVRGLADVSGNQITVSGWLRHADVPRHPAFLPPVRAEFRHTPTQTVESILAMVSTYSYVIALADDQRAAFTDRVEAYLRTATAPPGHAFAIPHVTSVVRTAAAPVAGDRS